MSLIHTAHDADYMRVMDKLGSGGSSSKLRIWQRPLLVQVPKPVAIAALLIVCTVSYLMALQGGDLVYINEHLGVIGAELLVSVLSLTTVTIMLYACRMRNSTRRTVVILMLAILAALYLYDHGERFEHHGLYNLLVFMAIYIPLSLAIAILYTLWCNIKHFPVYFAIALVISGISAGVSLLHYRKIFDQGTLGSFHYIPGECQWAGRNIPVVDLLPAKTQNFWAGSMSCKAEAISIKATIDPQGILRVNCGEHDVRAHIDILPDTRDWALRDKDMWKVYNHMVLKETVRLPYIRDSPFVLNKTTQAVVVNCGKSSTIVTRVSPPVHKLPMYVPPPDSDTRVNYTTKKTVPTEHFNAASNLDAQTTRPNVIFIMLDAVSHRQFYRRLPKSAQVLKSIHRPGTNRLYELYRYHSVGFSTDNNTRAMYTGEVISTRPNPLPIWAYFRDRGYVTARVETGCDDWAREYIGDKFLSDTYSVGNRSLDYELASPFCLPDYYPNVGNPFGNFKGPYSITARCLYGRYVHDWALDYLGQLRREFRSIQTLKNKQGKRRPYMLTATFLEGHEGTGEVLGTLDNSLSSFLEDIRDSGELEDTLLIIGADHGLHMGINFAYTQNGRIEHQNPFMTMSVPEWLYQFAEKYQHNYASENVSPFSANEQRLTTPFEIHHTFRVMADWPHC
ncbi:hypothetical protein LPJ66_007105 [Kickxella alabastrina]|uniref:Uncharacterized protein n=1 Tax=Kickxella alabastrina TaxID=61397 RepID=A0ACC1IDT5_9FUNG|nr:hypothetical protein LPJ66_007105 [Kickxella alabastrina]